MKQKKLLWFLGCIVLLLLISINSTEAIEIDTSDIEINEECTFSGISNFLNSWDALRAGYWGAEVWGYDSSGENKHWAPSVAGIQSVGTEKVIFRMYFTEEEIAYFKNNRFIGTDTRIPFAIELDVVDKNGVFGDPEIEDFEFDASSFPSEAQVKVDVLRYDDYNQMAIIVARPDKLESQKIYEIVFTPHIETVKTGEIHLNLQLAVNYKWISAMEKGYSAKCDLLDTIGVFRNFNSTQSWSYIGDDYGFDMPSEAYHGWYYFSASGADMTNSISVGPYVDNQVCWNDFENSEHNDSGSQYCGDLFTLNAGDDLFGSDSEDEESEDEEDPEGENEDLTTGTIGFGHSDFLNLCYYNFLSDENCCQLDANALLECTDMGFPLGDCLEGRTSECTDETTGNGSNDEGHEDPASLNHKHPISMNFTRGNCGGDNWKNYELRKKSQFQFFIF